MPWKKKHRERKSPRTKDWDYGQTATYFVTVCTKNRISYFGEIQNGIIGLSHIGSMVNEIWLQIPGQFPHVELNEYIVMPNHVHGILTIYDQGNDNHRDAINRVPMENDMTNGDRVPMENRGGATGLYNPMLSYGNLGKVIRWYKGRCSYEIHRGDYRDFQWQGRYWDRIIENDQSLYRIRKYIYDNPLNWNIDQLHEIN